MVGNKLASEMSGNSLDNRTCAAADRKGSASGPRVARHPRGSRPSPPRRRNPSGRAGAAGEGRRGGEGAGGVAPERRGAESGAGTSAAGEASAARPAGGLKGAGTCGGRRQGGCPGEKRGGGRWGARGRGAAAAAVRPRPPARDVAPGGSVLLGGTVPTAVPGAVGAAGPGGGPRLARPRLARPGAAAARHDGEQSGEAGPRLQAPGAAAAGAQRAAGAGLPGGRVVERGAGQLPQRAALRQEAALRLPRGARGHARRHRHLLLAQQRGAARGLHLAPAAAAAQVRAAGPRDPRHRLPRRRHLHQGRLPAGGGERGAACDGRLRAGVVGASRRVATGRAVGPRAGGRGMETWGGGGGPPCGGGV